MTDSFLFVSHDFRAPVDGARSFHMFQLVGLREKIQETPIFRWKIYGFL